MPIELQITTLLTLASTAIALALPQEKKEVKFCLELIALCCSGYALFIILTH